MQRTLRVAGHEFLRHIRRPSFLFTTLFLPLVVGLVFLLSNFTDQRSTADAPAPETTAPTSGTPIGYVDASGLLPPPSAVATGRLQAFADEASAQTALQQSDIVGYYRVPADYLTGGMVGWVGNAETGPEGEAAMRELLRTALLRDNPVLATRLTTPPTFRTVPTEPDGGPGTATPDAQPNAGPVAFIIPYAFALILYVTIFSAASFLLQSVTEEKENRTIEIVLTSVRPLQLLAGKVLGLGLLGLVQVAIWLGSGLLLLQLSGVALPSGTALAIPWVVIALAIVYYVLGYLVYGSLLAAVGATVTNVREGSQLVGLLIIPCIIPLFFLGAIIAQPNSLLATVLSLVPFTAPITMMIRVPLTPIAPWEIAVSVVLLAVTAALLLWFAARLFRAGVLLAGQRLSARAVLRALRAA
ncbi:MAG: ABC transporter permease [Chloroflexaceae bacterium]|nr:ABC transporter permease [Chloroflexaceae bacterium]